MESHIRLGVKWPRKSIGTKINWKQFSLQVFIDGFVGAMVGFEIMILPDLASLEFGLVVNTAILSFIANFCEQISIHENGRIPII